MGFAIPPRRASPCSDSSAIVWIYVAGLDANESHGEQCPFLPDDDDLVRENYHAPDGEDNLQFLLEVLDPTDTDKSNAAPHSLVGRRPRADITRCLSSISSVRGRTTKR